MTGHIRHHTFANNLLTSCESAPREGPVRLAAEMGTPTAEAAGYDAFLDGDLNVYGNYIHSDGPCDTNGTTNQPGIANNLLTSCESAPREGPVRLGAELGTPTAEAAGYDAFLDVELTTTATRPNPYFRSSFRAIASDPARLGVTSRYRSCNG